MKDVGVKCACGCGELLDGLQGLHQCEEREDIYGNCGVCLACGRFQGPDTQTLSQQKQEYASFQERALQKLMKSLQAGKSETNASTVSPPSRTKAKARHTEGRLLAFLIGFYLFILVRVANRKGASNREKKTCAKTSGKSCAKAENKIEKGRWTRRRRNCVVAFSWR